MKCRAVANSRLLICVHDDGVSADLRDLGVPPAQWSNSLTRSMDSCGSLRMPKKGEQSQTPSKFTEKAALRPGFEEVSMPRGVRVIAASVGILLLPTLVYAQATIAGVVRDPSAAVLPGVSVEASSSALIEKTRTVVSDGTGQYRITDLPPGTYVLTFTLQGFTTVKRDALAVSGSCCCPLWYLPRPRSQELSETRQLLCSQA